METQDVIAFDTDRIAAEQERGDDAALRDVFQRQLRASHLVDGIAHSLYMARSIYIGGGTVPWYDLTPEQRATARTEVQLLITTAKGER